MSRDNVYAPLPKGYKRTEVGVIPEDWDIKVLRDLEFDISDGNYSSKYPKSSEFKQTGVPFIRANNINGFSITDKDMRFISNEQHKRLQKGHLKRGDILLSTRGELGKIALVPERHIGSNINAQIVRINTNGKVDNVYMAYYLAYDIAQRMINEAESGSALKQLPVGKLVALPVILPPLPVHSSSSPLITCVMLPPRASAPKQADDRVCLRAALIVDTPVAYRFCP